MSDVQTLLTGLAIGESPRWHQGRLWFSNWVAQEIVAVDPASGQSEVVLRLPFPSYPFSIDWLPDGRLLVASFSDQPLLRQEPSGDLVPHAAVSRRCNEIVVDRRGNIYLNGADFDPTASQGVAPGVVVLVTPDGAARQVVDGLAFPNGMAVTPDNATLIVAESYARQLTAFDIQPDGSLSNRRVWAALGQGTPDGICLDAEGAAWYADVPNHSCTRVRQGGQVLQTVSLERGCFACMLGGADGRTLFMLETEWRGFGAMATAPRTGRLLTAPAPAPHAGWP